MHLPSKTRQYAAVGTLVPEKLKGKAEKQGEKSSLLPKVLPVVVGAVLLSYAYKALVAQTELPEEDPGQIDSSPVQTDSTEASVPTDQPPEVKDPGIKPLEQKPVPEAVPLPKKPSLLTDWVQKLKSLFSWSFSSTRSEKNEKKGDPGSTPPSPTSSKKTLSDKPLPDGYRSKFTFPEFNGSSSIAKYGSFTQDEANTIIRLKTSGANTAASGGMSESVRQLIIAKARAYGLDPERMLKVAAIESGGNPNAISSTGAIGIFQFTGDTASRVGLLNRFDVESNIEAGMLLAVKNTGVLKNMGLEANEVSLYLTHQLGPSAAKEVLQAADRGDKAPISSLSKSTRAAVRKNLGGNTARTAKEYVDNTAYHLQSKYASIGGKPVETASKETAPPVSTASIPSPAQATRKEQVDPPSSTAVAQERPTAVSKVKEIKSKDPRSERYKEAAQRESKTNRYSRKNKIASEGTTEMQSHSLANIPEEPEDSIAAKFAQHYLRPSADSPLDVPPGAEQHPASGRLAYGSAIDLMRSPSGLVISTG